MTKPSAAMELFVEEIRNGTTASDKDLEEARRQAEMAAEHEELHTRKSELRQQ